MAIFLAFSALSPAGAFPTRRYTDVSHGFKSILNHGYIIGRFQSMLMLCSQIVHKFFEDYAIIVSMDSLLEVIG